MQRTKSPKLRLLLALGLMMGVIGAAAQPAAAAESGALFMISNAASGNEVLVYERGADGMLSHVGSVATGGNGSGDGLGSQGSVTLTDNGRWLLVVNAGSDSVSVFRVDGTSLTLTDTEASRGDRPESVDIHRDLVYVLNAASADVSGYRLVNGNLMPINPGVRELSAESADPAQVEFSPDGSSILVTEKATNLLTVFGVNARGNLSMGSSSPSAGMTPFGFEFDRRGHAIVSEAFGGAPGLSTVSSYDLSRRQATVIETEATTQTAACWVAITSNGAYAYSANTGSGTVSRFALASDGTLTLLGHTESGASPIDIDLTGDDSYAYVVNAEEDSISVFAVGSDGSLTMVQKVTGIPATALGIATP